MTEEPRYIRFGKPPRGGYSKHQHTGALPLSAPQSIEDGSLIQCRAPVQERNLGKRLRAPWTGGNLYYTTREVSL